MAIPNQINIDGLNNSINKLTKVIEKSNLLDKSNDGFSDVINKVNDIVNKTDIANSINGNLTVLGIIIGVVAICSLIFGVWTYIHAESIAKNEAKKEIKKYIEDFDKDFGKLKDDINDLRNIIASIKNDKSSIIEDIDKNFKFEDKT